MGQLATIHNSEHSLLFSLFSTRSLLLTFTIFDDKCFVLFFVSQLLCLYYFNFRTRMSHNENIFLSVYMFHHHHHRQHYNYYCYYYPKCSIHITRGLDGWILDAFHNDPFRRLIFYAFQINENGYVYLYLLCALVCSCATYV